MTTSTKMPKAKKSTGPIRTGAVAPTLIIITLLGVYFSVFFDGHVRRGIEYAGTHIVGAEVDVARVSTSFLRARLEIDGIEVTDKEHPERNLVEVGNIRFELLWDALLRAKVVVNEASILNIQALSPRQHPGYVVPPTPPDSSGKKSAALEEVEDAVVSQTRKQYNGNFLGDLAGILGSGDSKTALKNLENELKSEARIQELKKELDEKKKAWDVRIKALPQAKELQQYGDRVKALKFDINKPAEFAKNVQEADKIIKEASEKVKQIDQTQKDLKSDVGTYSQAFKDLEKMVQQDVRDLQSRLKIPSLDAKEFSQQLFMSMIEKKLGSVFKYAELARHYMPPPKTAEQKKADKDAQIVPPQRGQGKNFRFPITTGYPLFWLKNAAISSQMNSSEFSGNLKGEIKDLTTDPAHIGRPTLILAQGDFPKQGIMGLDAKITLDHVTEIAKESMKIKISTFPVTGNKLSDSTDVKLAITEAKGTSNMDAVFTNGVLAMSLRNSFGDIKYDLDAKNKMVKEIISSILKDIPTVSLNADIKGSLHNLDIQINSNLGEELSKGFQKQLQAKINEAKAQLQKQIDERIGNEKDKLKAELDKITGSLTKEVDGKKADADKIVKDAQNQATGKQGGGQKKKLEEEGKKLLNKFLGG